MLRDAKRPSLGLNRAQRDAMLLGAAEKNRVPPLPGWTVCRTRRPLKKAVCAVLSDQIAKSYRRKRRDIERRTIVTSRLSVRAPIS